MMITEIVRERANQALKEKNGELRNFYTFLLSELKNASIEAHHNLSREEEEKVVSKVVKTLKKDMEAFEKCGAGANVTTLKNQIAAYEEFMPKPLMESEVLLLWEECGKPEKRQFMKIAKEKFGSRFDGKLINEVLKV